VRENPQVICTLHKGITAGLLEGLAPQARLLVFEPHDPDVAGCLVEMVGPRLRSRDEFRHQAHRVRPAVVRRSEALRSLSRDHHHALAVAQRLRRSADVATAKAEFLEFWRTDGRHHFQIEEEVLLPYWAVLGSVDESAAAQLSREHLRIRASAIALETAELPLARLQELGETLAAHVRFEERQLFALIEADLDERRLARLAEAMIAAEQRR
jgi:hypothetical protein